MSAQPDELTQPIEVLQRPQDDLGHVARERDQLNFDAPPPYQYVEIMWSPTPDLPVIDQSYERFKRRRARGKSKPFAQFMNQAKREEKRLQDQRFQNRFGRRLTLPVDGSLSLEKSAENSVRSRWVEQGIWGDEWGPAWHSDPAEGGPKDNSLENPLTDACNTASVDLPRHMQPASNGPFSGEYSPDHFRAPGARWGHEDRPDPPPKPQEELEPPSMFGHIEPKRPKSPEFYETKSGRLRLRCVPRPTVRDPEASRPCVQFLYQISKEREWIKDENSYAVPGKPANLDKLAYESVKKNWMEDGIWQPSWDSLPGQTWLHEEPDPDDSDEEEPGNPAVTSAPQKRLTGTTDGQGANANAGDPSGSAQRSIFAPASGPDPVTVTTGSPHHESGDGRSITSGRSTEGDISNISRHWRSKRRRGDDAVDAPPPAKRTTRRHDEHSGHSHGETAHAT